jgi:enamine deaminase RidA (YjgF/YER057c/UK114 family)
MKYRIATALGTLAFVVVFVTGWMSATSAQAVRRYVNLAAPSDTSRGPFSGAVLVGETLYLSGQLGVTRTQTTPDSPEVEATKVLTAVSDTLKSAEMTMDDLVVVQVFCSDVTHYDAFNKVYRTMFKRELPARAFIGAGKLLFNARFEVQGIAVKRR